MKIKKFIKILNKLYSSHRVKYYAQPGSFSFEIYNVNTAFHGTPYYKSNVYPFWDTVSDTRKEIIDHIKDALRETKKRALEETDLYKFLKLYKSVGIDVKLNSDGEHDTIILATDHRTIDLGVTRHEEKIKGYIGFCTSIDFDKKTGKFIKQNIYE